MTVEPIIFFPDMMVLHALLGVIAIVLADFLLGVLLAFVNGEFELTKLPLFLKENLLPYVGALLILAFISTVSPAVKIIFFVAVGLATLKFLADLKTKLTSIGMFKE